jgi:cardiolipin synthase
VQPRSALVRAIPNLLTGLRIAAAPALAWAIIQGNFRAAIALVILAGISDGLDGYSARRLGSSGKLGVVLDPLADKVMLVVLFCALTYARTIPLWFLVLAIVRDLVIVIGALLVRIFRQIRTFPPRVLGKVSTFFQIVYALLALAWAAFPLKILLWLDVTALLLATLFTVLSGIDYVQVGIRMAARRTAAAAAPN